MADGVNLKHDTFKSLRDRLMRSAFHSAVPAPWPNAKLQGHELTGRWIDEVGSFNEDMLKDLVRYGQSASRIHRASPNKPLSEIDNATLVMEMIARGFAVMKLPEGGGPPEALKDG